VMALPGQPQTFAIDNCRDMLEKLDWEIDQLKHPNTILSVDSLKYGCFNAAVTAWQIGDWVHADLTDAQRTALSIGGTLGDLQAKVRAECRELYLCRQIATASKHQKVTAYVDRTIDAGIEATSPVPVSGPVSFNAWDAYIDDNGTKRRAIDVFETALHYWTSFIYQNQIAA
jgi:hypothetical protein